MELLINAFIVTSPILVTLLFTIPVVLYAKNTGLVAAKVAWKYWRYAVTALVLLMVGTLINSPLIRPTTVMGDKQLELTELVIEATQPIEPLVLKDSTPVHKVKTEYTEFTLPE